MRTDKILSEPQVSLHQMLRPIHSCQQDQSPRPFLMVDYKARQSAKIREVGEALIADGICALDQQAKALGLSRSTTWTILKANHKSSGLSAAIINRMLAAPQLPPRVRLKIFEYIREKSVGRYGDNERKIVKFTARISANIKERALTAPRA
jgi:predicted DNA-binding transcriptional regulator AlpA